MSDTATKYSPEDQALIDQVNADWEAEYGYQRLWRWFGLSRASFLTLPRIFMHEMPEEWQDKMARLLEEYEDTFNLYDLPKAYVSARKENRFTDWPEWLLNYRRPDKGQIDSRRKEIVE